MRVRDELQTTANTDESAKRVIVHPGSLGHGVMDPHAVGQSVAAECLRGTATREDPSAVQRYNAEQRSEWGSKEAFAGVFYGVEKMDLGVTKMREHITSFKERVGG